jgi:hypothetical protein
LQGQLFPNSNKRKFSLLALALIQTQNEFDIYQNRVLSQQENEHLAVFIMRIFDANKLLLPLINLKNTATIDTKPVSSIYKEFLDRTIPIIEPATEYLDFEFHYDKFVKLAETVRFPREVMNYLHLKNRKQKNCSNKEYKKWKNANHRKFWYGLQEKPRQLNALITDYFDLESKFETKTLVPPVPFVENDILFDIAVQVNDMGKALAIDRGECATYFLLSKSILRDKTILDKIVDYMRKDPTTLTMLKFKNLKLWESERFTERENFRDLMEAISEIKRKNTTRLFMLLEASYQCFPASSYGFDVVSSSMRLLDQDSAYGENKGYGGYFYEEQLLNAKYYNLPEIMRNNHWMLPCSCRVCRGITYDEDEGVLKFNGKKISIDEWSALRREHNLFVMNGLMEMISRAIHDKQIEMVRQKISNSEVSNLKTLIPQHYILD